MWKGPAWMPWWRTALGWAPGAQSGGRRRMLLSWHHQHSMQRTVSAALTQNSGYKPGVLEQKACISAWSSKQERLLQCQALPTMYPVLDAFYAQCLLSPGKGEQAFKGVGPVNHNQVQATSNNKCTVSAVDVSVPALYGALLWLPFLMQ